MNLGQGSFRLLLVVFALWTAVCGVAVASREYTRVERAHSVDCQIRRQTIAGFDMQKCLDDPAVGARKREDAIAGAKAWFVDLGYLIWLVPPFLITAILVILIAAGAFVYRGFVAD